MVTCGMSGRLRTQIALIGLLALGIRLFYILAIAPAPTGVGGDAGFYHSAANLIANGHFLYRGIFGHAYHTAEHPPLYPLVLSVSSLAGGDTLTAHRVVSCVIGTGGVILIAILARRVAGDRAGLIAAAVAAVYPPFITADGLVMSEPLFVLTVTAALLAALALLQRPSVSTAALLGAAIALATLTRGEGILLLPLLAWPAAVLADGSSRRDRALAATATAALILAPWVIRNAVVFHDATLAADSNTVVAGANCPQTYYGHDIGWWSNRCLERARTREELLVGEASTSAAYSYAGDHLTRLPLIAVVRVLRTFNFFQPLRQGNREPRAKWVDIVGLVIYYPLLVLAVIGAVRLADHRARWVLLAPVAMVIIVSALTWGIGRFRIAADVSIIVFAAATFAATPPRARAGSTRRAAASDPAQPAGSATSSRAWKQTMRALRPRTGRPSRAAARGV
jgi:4-amino-4-deoxy-L-arabinose transferase-like glycosyltransferase